MTNPMATALELAPLIERVHGPNHPELTRVRELTFAIDGETGPARVGELFTELREVTGNYTLLDVRASGQAALIPLGAHRVCSTLPTGVWLLNCPESRVRRCACSSTKAGGGGGRHSFTMNSA